MAALANERVRHYVAAKRPGVPMVKVVYASLQQPKRGPSPAVTRKRVKRADGATETILVLDGDSPSFADDLTYAFKRNVARVRRENKRLFGSPSGAVAKA